MTRELVDDKLMEWLERGLDIEVLRRTNRAGYKAGTLKEVSQLYSNRYGVLAHLLGRPAVKCFNVSESRADQECTCRACKDCKTLTLLPYLTLTSSQTVISW